MLFKPLSPWYVITAVADGKLWINICIMHTRDENEPEAQLYFLPSFCPEALGPGHSLCTCCSV